MLQLVLIGVNRVLNRRRTLSYIYGPERQRPHLSTKFFSKALSYEKEIKGGMTEERHYLSAAGITFAVAHLRSGTLGSKPAQEVMYWHHDHLGSVAAVSNDKGQLALR